MTFTSRYPRHSLLLTSRDNQIRLVPTFTERSDLVSFDCHLGDAYFEILSTFRAGNEFLRKIEDLRDSQLLIQLPENHLYNLQS